MKHKRCLAFITLSLVSFSPLVIATPTLLTKECQPCEPVEDTCCNDRFFCKSYFAKRSEGSDTARRLVGDHRYTYTFNKKGIYGTFNITNAFQRSFNKPEIGIYFAPQCCGNCLIFGFDEEPHVLRSADFGLPANFFFGVKDPPEPITSTVCLCPQTSSYIAEASLKLAAPFWCPRFFFNLYAPLTYTFSEINCVKDENLKQANIFYFCGQMTASESRSKNVVGAVNAVTALHGNTTWGDVANTLKFGKITCNTKNRKTRIADLQAVLGYNGIEAKNYRLGYKLIVKAPTGNSPNAERMFEPIVGNGGHWELGGGLIANMVLWKNKTSEVEWFIDADVTHLFTSRWQKRLFDLKKNGCFSRYLLLKEFGNRGTSYSALERGPNLFAQRIKVSVGVQADITSMLSYSNKEWTVDIGYNFWGRTAEQCEKICCTIPEKTYGIKGNTVVIGSASFVSGQNLIACSNTSQTPPLTTDSTATIHKANGFAGDGAQSPIFVTCDDINISSALAPAAHSHAAFGNLTYIWHRKTWDEYLGVGAKVELSGSGNTALDQWTLWAKAGISF